ncbi:hypothetical protein CC1G_01894 [Coprinopsis cinerea okayama7|uniref:Uncharacterized protein n=1 Tax=Coprinopsis cinerea (strain Okayama-7 / 130 / ATCC MYA-4618 / FGSC 9003) TaxID=240176 RepID=A8N5W3_COPC7|nr:hypothetical protein CC1G_01894 [Coprinopsis cinerea okayama7\|eukprot:XP_001830258.1 hypothetical protein CC1G_01894 [Coprinopsis cinerea okayama7\
MCSLNTEGTQHGCGHYIITKKIDKQDCNSKFCINSRLHAPNCPHCPNCKRYFDPDYQETITQRTNDFCSACNYWFNGAGKQQQQQPSQQRR